MSRRPEDIKQTYWQVRYCHVERRNGLTIKDYPPKEKYFPKRVEALGYAAELRMSGKEVEFTIKEVRRRPLDVSNRLGR